MSVDNGFVVLKSNGVPNHPSAYFPRTDSRYEADLNPGFRAAPNGQIRPFNLEFRIPLNPRKADNAAPTRLGPMGIALDGVALYNQYNGNDQPLTNEIVSFDQCNGHPDPMGMYHYHVEPVCLTKIFGRDALIGFLLDGFPVYGPVENGKVVTNRDLDALHGHSHATADYPNGIYHYHVTSDAPYINGNGFYGTPGRVNFSP